jgi:tetratricopeptide (TPR) repeat protein
MSRPHGGTRVARSFGQVRQPTVFPFQKPAAGAAPADAIGNALRLPDKMRALSEQQARLRPIPGLKDSLGTQVPVPAPPATPRSAWAWRDLGLTCAAMRDYPAAIGALREAVRLEPALRDCWRKLAELLRLPGERAAAAAAALAADAASPPPPPAIPPTNPDMAERQVRAEIAGQAPDFAALLLREKLRQTPTDAAALRVLADLMLAQERQAEAEALFERALELAPAYHAARHAYAVALYKSAKEAYAVPHVERLVAHDPQHPGYRALLGACLTGSADIGRSIAIFESVTKDAPRETAAWMSYGNALLTAGRRDEARRAFRHCLSIMPESGEAYWYLQNLTADKPEGSDVAAMRHHLAHTAMSDENRFHLHYALAHALEKQAEYAESFAQYDAGARIWRARISYSAERTTQHAQDNARYFTAARFAARAGQGCPDPAPIFIVGLPRAGSTLIEQILSCHPLVEGTYELPELGFIIHDLLDRAGETGYPDCLDALDAGELAALGARYIETTRIYRNTEKPYFIDKMPGNWAGIGLIRMILPNAKIIDARRDPMGNCFGAFKKFYARGQYFSYDLTDLGHYYNDYLDLMAHFDAVLPGHVHRVVYETMVTDTEAEIRRLLDHCGLPFEPACVRFWENRRPVRTASVDQVRRPIFRDAMDQWRHYEPWLGPLKQALQRAT